MVRKKHEKKLRRFQEDLSVHHLYEASVQSVEADADFLERVWGELRGGTPQTLREDFCGTASLCAEWVSRGPERRAWGVDLDQPTLDWGAEHRVALVDDGSSRVELVRDDVRTVKRPQVQIQVAFNFSYFAFLERATMAEYFRAVRQSLVEGGLFLLDIFGGIESELDLEESTEHEAQVDPDGTEIPAFTYVWVQDRFNAIDRNLRCGIHFEVDGGPKLKRVFGYDWRFWTLAELRDLLEECGYRTSHVWCEGWDDDADEGDGDFQRTATLENEGGYVCYLIAER